MSEQAFDGVRVIELAQWVFVPVAGALLADWGADVVHIEPTEGDPYRGLATQGIGTDRGGVNLSLALANRGKRSIALNIQSEAGRAVLHRLLESADVFLTNMRPKALRRLGLDAETLTERYPSLVCAMGSGYGARGPDADRPGYDATAFWARGGMAHMLSPPEREYPIGQRGALGDRNAALALAFGVAGALLKRSRTGRGSVVDVSLLATAIWTLSSDVLAALGGDAPDGVEWARAAGEPPRRGLPDEGREAHSARVPPARPLLGRILPAHRTPGPLRRSPVRHHAGAAGERRGLCRRAR